jgi:uncharacterized protein YkwD
MINWIDIFLVLVIVLSALSGWRRGFLLGFVDLVRLIGSWVVALLLYRPLSNLLGVITDWEEIWRLPIALVFLVVLSGILIHALGRRLIKRVPREYHLRRANRLLGVVPGMISGILMAAILAGLLFSMPLSEGMSKSVQESRLAANLAGLTDGLDDTLGPVFQPAINATLDRLKVVQPGTSESVQLPFKVENTVPVPELEAQMLELVNQERAANGLKPVQADPELTEVARRHSADMFARGYFSHNTPEGKDPFDRMRESNVKFRTAGENLALAPTLQIAHSGLMNSPGHRANILSPQFGRLGIGIMRGGRRGIMVSQEFRN